VKNEWSYTTTPHVPSWHALGSLYLLAGKIVMVTFRDISNPL